MIVIEGYPQKPKVNSSYRGYDLIYLGDEVLIYSAKDDFEPIDSASNISEAQSIIDSWLNAP